jgi:LemA protein
MNALYIAAGILIVVLIAWIIIKNSLIAKDNQVKNAFSLIDVMLKQRFDMIPQLIELVKGYMAHEKGLLESLTKIRMGARSTEELAQSNHLVKEQFAQFSILAEAYPDLKASEQFLNLQRNISDMEEKLAAARRTYNASIEEYNNAVMQFPSSIVAQKSNFQVKEFLKFND